MGVLFKRKIQTVFCLVLVASLTNGLLLAVQAFAWAAMVLDRTEELGLEQAIVSTIEGKELCDVCIIVRSETKKQGDASSYQLVDIFVKAMSSGENDSDVLPFPRVGQIRYGRCDWTTAYGFFSDVLGPPPRLKV